MITDFESVMYADSALVNNSIWSLYARPMKLNTRWKGAVEAAGRTLSGGPERERERGKERGKGRERETGRD